jgi:hypothetical protein
MRAPRSRPPALDAAPAAGPRDALGGAERGGAVSAQAEARRKRAATRGDLYLKRPDSEPGNSPVPRYSWLVQHAMIASDAIIYRAIESLKPVDLPGGTRGQGRLLHNASVTRIAQATAAFTHDKRAMPRRTVAHRLAVLHTRHIAVEWTAESGPRPKNSPSGTSRRLVPFAEILATWAEDPAIATIAAAPGKRAFYVRGKAKRFCTPAEVEAWITDHAAMIADPRAHASAVDLGEPAATPAAAGPAALPDLGPLTDALIEVSGRGTDEDAAWIWQEVVRASGRHELPPVDEAARTVRRMGADRRKMGQQALLDHGLIRKKIAGYLNGWRRNRSAELAAQAKAAQWEREQRINGLALMIKELARADLSPPEREGIAGALAHAPPDELDAAQNLLDSIAARSA